MSLWILGTMLGLMLALKLYRYHNARQYVKATAEMRQAAREVRARIVKGKRPRL